MLTDTVWMAVAVLGDLANQGFLIRQDAAKDQGRHCMTSFGLRVWHRGGNDWHTGAVGGQ